MQHRRKVMNQCKCGLCETVPHDSDCAVHNEPATPNGDCDCKGEAITRKVLSPPFHDNITPEMAKQAVVAVMKGPDRPDSIALITALEDAINEIASEKMTAIEVLGCLDLVGKRFYETRLSSD
jgi:hypothetical protein